MTRALAAASVCTTSIKTGSPFLGDSENIEEKEGQVPVFRFQAAYQRGAVSPFARFHTSWPQHRKTRLIGDNKVFTVHLWPQNM